MTTLHLDSVQQLHKRVNVTTHLHTIIYTSYYVYAHIQISVYYLTWYYMSSFKHDHHHYLLLLHSSPTPPPPLPLITATPIHYHWYCYRDSTHPHNTAHNGVSLQITIFAAVIDYIINLLIHSIASWALPNSTSSLWTL